MTVLAVVVAVVTVLGHRTHTEAILDQDRATDMWGYYQAHKIRANDTALAADLLSVVAVADKDGAKKLFKVYADHQAKWADDLKAAIELELKELDLEIKSVKRDAKLEASLENKLQLHRRAKDLESQRSKKRRELFVTQDEIDVRKETLISEVEARLQQKVQTEELFTVRWSVM